MSGHSKWHNIKLKKGKVDAQRGALFTKLSKEIILAAKGGSPDPEANYRLKMAVEKARENNMPQDNIKRAIARAAGAEGEREIDEIRYEGYGPAGSRARSSTPRRTTAIAPPPNCASCLAAMAERSAKRGSVAWMFEPRGLIEVENGGRDEEALTEAALIDGVVDVHFDDGSTEGRSVVATEPAALAAVREALVAQRRCA